MCKILANMTQVSDVAPGPLVNSRQSIDKQADITGVCTGSFTGSFSQLLQWLQQSSLPIQPFDTPNVV
jgi:hypothetical protein